VATIAAAATSSYISNPPVTGTTTQKKQLRAAFQELSRNGNTGYIEAMALRYYGITVSASSKYGFSTYVGNRITIHPNVLTYGRKYTAQVMAHEMGHAIFQRTGLYAQTYYRGLPRGVHNAVDEAFAGVLANRVKRAQYPSTPRSSLLNEFYKVAKNPFYARYYGFSLKQIEANRGAVYDALRGTVPTLRAFGVRDSTLTKGL
jgi:hypothetical protein